MTRTETMATILVQIWPSNMSVMSQNNWLQFEIISLVRLVRSNRLLTKTWEAGLGAQVSHPKMEIRILRTVALVPYPKNEDVNTGKYYSRTLKDRESSRKRRQLGRSNIIATLKRYQQPLIANSAQVQSAQVDLLFGASRRYYPVSKM